jgi:hypothetical protein
MTDQAPDDITQLRKICAYLFATYPALQEIELGYYGAGDSGDIGNIEFKFKNLDQETINKLKTEIFNSVPQHPYTPSPGHEQWTVEKLLDDLGWDIAYEANPGFEINDGGAGTITIVVDPRQPFLIGITLRHEEYFTETRMLPAVKL